MKTLNIEQQRIYNENRDLADWLACRYACAEADYYALLPVAEQALRSAIVNHIQSVHGDFEQYATGVIERDLGRFIYSNGNSLFTIERKKESEDEDEDDYMPNASPLEYQIDRILREAGFEEDKGLGDDEFIFS